MDGLFRKRIFFFGIGIVSICSVVLSGLFLYAYPYRDRVLPGVSVGSIPVGGLARAELIQLLHERIGDLAETGIDITYETDKRQGGFILYPVSVTEDTTTELIRVDVDAAADAILMYGREGNGLFDLVAPVISRVGRPSVVLSGVVADRDGLRQALEERLSAYEFFSKNAGVVITGMEPFAYTVTEEVFGIGYDYEAAIGEIIRAWEHLEDPVAALAREVASPEIRETDVRAMVNDLQNVFAVGPLIVTSTAGGKARVWTISINNIAEGIVPRPSDAGLVWGLDEKKLTDFFEGRVAPLITIEARDAKFRVDEKGKTLEFQGSRTGLAVDLAVNIARVEDAIARRARGEQVVEISLAIVVSEPRISTAAVNNLGITEVLGAGISNYSGSPPNRIKNIRHAVKKLNGVLVKPGETFSTLDHLGPFTEADGYLPELVIKGDELKPDIGGGLCQIGTTLFRMAMEGGMPITERRNHSLVVSYYGDARNGNPGTDATLYEPWPDFKFTNDTGHHVLIQTSMDEKTGELAFALWGTSDGRDASYSAPVVKKWIPHGEPKIILTDKLPPGEKKCQKAFNGAEASFVYTRKLPDGTDESRVFESYYRPLPEICLVGVAASTTNQNLGYIEPNY